MKPYSILIHGTGTCGEGNAQSADMALQKLLEQLRSSGHSLTSVSMVINGSAVPIIGALQPHPAADAPASPDAVSMVTVNASLQELIHLLTVDKQPGEVLVGHGTEDQTPPAVTLEAIREELAGMMELVTLNGQPVTVLRGLPSVFEQLDRIEASQKKDGGAPKGPKEAKPRGAKKEGPAGEDKPGAEVKLINDPPKGAGFDADGKPAVLGGVPAGSLPLPGSPLVEDPTNDTGPIGADDEGSTTSETTGNEERAEG